MENTYKLIWSNEALSNLKNIIDYLEDRWTTKEIQKFSRLLDKKLQLIERNPLLFQASPNSNELRRCILSKQTTIYYKIKNRQIYIVTLFDNRQDPKKLKGK